MNYDDKDLKNFETDASKSSEETPKEPEKKNKKPGALASFFKSKKTKRGSVAILLTVIFVAVVVVLNIVCSMLVTRFPALSTDLTASNVYELQETTVEYAESLTKDITIYVLSTESSFESQGEYYVQVNKLLHQFESYSDKIKLKYIDLMSNPTFTSSYKDVNWNASSYLILVECGKQYRALEATDIFSYNQEAMSYYGEYVVEKQNVEQAVVTAILNVTNEDKVGVTVLSGNGELDCEYFIKTLEDNAYDVETVSLLNGKISKDSQFLVMYAPTNDIDETSYDTITDWLYNGGDYGHTLLYIPNDKVQSELPNIDALLEQWGMSVTKDYIYETDQSHMTNTQNPYLITIFDYMDESFTEKLGDTKIPVVMLYTMPIEILDEDMATALLSSSDKAIKMPLDAGEDWDYSKEESAVLNGAVISTKQDKEQKNTSNIVVVGSYDALSQGPMSTTSFNNSAYFVNMFNTIANRDDVGITIEGKNLDAQQLGITSNATSGVISVIFRFILPLLVLVIGLVVWLRRRNR